MKLKLEITGKMKNLKANLHKEIKQNNVQNHTHAHDLKRCVSMKAISKIENTL